MEANATTNCEGCGSDLEFHEWIAGGVLVKGAWYCASSQCEYHIHPTPNQPNRPWGPSKVSDLIHG